MSGSEAVYFRNVSGIFRPSSVKRYIKAYTEADFFIISIILLTFKPQNIILGLQSLFIKIFLKL